MMVDSQLIPIAFEDCPTADGNILRQTHFSNGLVVVEPVREGDFGLPVYNDGQRQFAPSGDMDRLDYSMMKTVWTEVNEAGPYDIAAVQPKTAIAV